jgi:hypothetical protein
MPLDIAHEGATLRRVEILIALSALLIIVFAILASRRPGGRRRNLEEALEDDALRKERDRMRTESMYLEDRYNVPRSGRRP